MLVMCITYNMLHSKLSFGVLLLTAYLCAATQVDLSGPGCDAPDGYSLPDRDATITVFHTPQYNTKATRDRCDVTVNSRSGTRIQYIIDNIRFNECGVEITIYETLGSDLQGRVITCSDNGKTFQGTSRYNQMRIKARKFTPTSRAFTFTMRVRDDRGPPLEYEQASENYVGEGLEPGAVVGMAIAGGIVIIALVLLAIYLCIRARSTTMKDTAASSAHGESSVFTSGNSQVLFAPGASRHPKGRYGSMEDIRSTASSQNKENGGYSNSAYTSGPGEKKSERSASVGRAKGRAGFANSGYSVDDSDFGHSTGDTSWEEREKIGRGGSQRRSRREAYDVDNGRKPLKSAMKKRSTDEMEMGRMSSSSQPNGILKRAGSPSRSQASSTEASLDVNAMIHGYSHSKSKTLQPNVRHQPVLERRRSRSGTRSHHSSSSYGRASSRDRQKSPDRKKPKSGGRMYSEDVFIADDSRNKRRSNSRGRPSRSLSSKRSDRTSDSVDSESSAPSSYSSRKVSMNPGGKRVQIKGTETDL